MLNYVFLDGKQQKLSLAVGGGPQSHTLNRENGDFKLGKMLGFPLLDLFVFTCIQIKVKDRGQTEQLEL